MKLIGGIVTGALFAASAARLPDARLNAETATTEQILAMRRFIGELMVAQGAGLRTLLCFELRSGLRISLIARRDHRLVLAPRRGYNRVHESAFIRLSTRKPEMMPSGDGAAGGQRATGFLMAKPFHSVERLLPPGSSSCSG